MTLQISFHLLPLKDENPALPNKRSHWGGGGVLRAFVDMKGHQNTLKYHGNTLSDVFAQTYLMHQ